MSIELMQSCNINNIPEDIKEDENRLHPLYEIENISGLQFVPIDWYSHEESSIESQTMDVILISIERLQKPYTLLPIHAVYHTFEYHPQNCKGTMELVRDDVTLDPTRTSNEIINDHHDLLLMMKISLKMKVFHLLLYLNPMV